MNKTLWIVFCIANLLIGNNLLAQNNSTLSLEAGLGKGIGSSLKEGYSSPFIKPLIGIHYQRPFVKYLFIRLGLQLQSRADKFDATTIYDDDYNSKRVYNSEFKVNRLMLPVKIGYQLNKGNWSLDASLGYRFAWMYKGKYTTTSIESNNLLQNPEVISGSINPFTNDRYIFRVIEYIELGDRKMYFQHHFVASLGATWKNKISVEGSLFLYRELKVLDDPLSQIPIYDYGNSMKISGGELLLSVIYHFPIKKKNILD